MEYDEGLMHDLNIMFGVLCKCLGCCARRDTLLTQDLNLYYGCTTIERAEAKRKAAIQ